MLICVLVVVDVATVVLCIDSVPISLAADSQLLNITTGVAVVFSYGVLVAGSELLIGRPLKLVRNDMGEE